MIKTAYRIISILAGLALVFGSHFNAQASSASAALLAGATYSVSVNGSDAGSCTSSAPCKTFNRALSLAQTGDVIYIQPGTYTETLSVSKSDLTIFGNGAVIDALGKSNGVNISGKNITLLGIVVKNSTSHAIKVSGQNVRVADSEVYNSVLECVSVDSACGSALKVSTSADTIVFENNYIHDNKSEGIAVTKGRNVIVRNNRVSNNMYVEIYVDNSSNVRVENNHIFCNKPNSTGLAFDEEYYSDWGQELYNLYISRNIVAGCSRGLGYWGSQGGIKTATIEYNTFYNLSESALYFASGANSNVLIRRNIFPNLKPWFDAKTGITMDDNFWVSTKPGSSTLASGPNDKTGTPLYAVPPVWNDPATFKQASTSPACGYGRWDCSGISLPTSTPMVVLPTNTPTATKTSVPAVPPTATNTTAPVQATFTALPPSTPIQPTFTATSIPLTATFTFTAAPSSTPLQPTVTSTALPPTATSIPPTVVNATEVTIDDPSNIFNYSINWKSLPDPQTLGGSYKMTSVRGETIKFTFTGQSFSILYMLGPDLRAVLVVVDGQPVATINQHDAVVKYNQRWDYPFPLSYGNHTIKLVAKNRSNSFTSFDGVIIR